MHVGSCGVMRLLIRGDTCTPWLLVTGCWMSPPHSPNLCQLFTAEASTTIVSTGYEWLRTSDPASYCCPADSWPFLRETDLRTPPLRLFCNRHYLLCISFLGMLPTESPVEWLTMVLVRTLPVTSLIDNSDPAMVICAVVMMDKWSLGHHLSAAVHCPPLGCWIKWF